MDTQTLPRPGSMSDLANALIEVAAARDTATIVEAIRSSARSLIGCDGIAVIRRADGLCYYVEEDAIGALWKGSAFPETACISGWSMINRQTVIIPDIAQDDRIPHELYAGTFVRSVAMTPVNVDAPIGAVGAYWSAVYTPTSEEIEVLEAIAKAAAAAYENIATPNSTKPRASIDEVLDLAADIDKVQAIAAVPSILDVALRMTGMGFAAVARVTQTHWVACQVLDPVGFG